MLHLSDIFFSLQPPSLCNTQVFSLICLEFLKLQYSSGQHIWFISASSLPNLGQGLLQFLCLLVCDDQGVKVSVASNFKLHITIFLDLDRFGILPPGCEQEVLDFLNFARHGYEASEFPLFLAYAETHSQPTLSYF